MDDILVFGKDNQQHRQCLVKFWELLSFANVTINPSKCEFTKP